MLVALTSCGGDDAAGSRPGELWPGETLFDHLDELVVESFAETNLPADLVEPVRAALARPSWRIPPEHWLTIDESKGTDFDLDAADTSAPRRAPDPSDPQRWWTRPPVRLDLDVGNVWLRHEGRSLRPVSRRHGKVEDDGRRARFWRDDRLDAVFAWDPDAGVIIAACPFLPGPLELGYVPEDVPLTELALVRGAPERARDLVRRVGLRRIDRPCLVAPAPTDLSLPLRRLGGDELLVSVGVVDVAYERDESEAARPAQGRSDGVTFVVEVRDDGVLRRVWSRHVQPGAGFVDARVNLSDFRNRAVTLRLRTEPGPDGDASFDYAVWGELRLAGPPRHPPRRPHVVLIDVDTLRADRLGCYGYERETSPRLDAWAAERAVVFTDTTSTNDWTLPATVSMLTGLAPSQHQVLTFPQRLDESMAPLASRLRAVGYETRARTDGGFVVPAFGFATGFDVFDAAERRRADHEREGWSEELRALAERRSERPVFLFLQTYQVHEPYLQDRRFEDPDAAYDGDLVGRRIRPPKTGHSAADRVFVNDLYDAGVRRMDDVVGPFLEGLDSALAGQPCLVLVTSDHGEELAERGVFGHGHSLHRELLSVPLIVAFPDRPAGRSDVPASLVDIVPTVLDAIGLGVPAYLSGRSLRRRDDELRLRVAQHADSAHAVQRDGHKLVVGTIDVAETLDSSLARRREELYRLADDAWERRDIAQEAPEVVEDLRKRLDVYLRRHGPRGADPYGLSAIDETVLADLAALGYLDGR